jgi:hypothetical protein
MNVPLGRRRKMGNAFVGALAVVVATILPASKMSGQTSVDLSNAQLTIPAGKQLRGVDSEKDLGFGATLVTIKILSASPEKDGMVLFDAAGRIAKLKNIKEYKEYKVELSEKAKPEAKELIEKSKILGWTKEGLVIETTDKVVKTVNPLKGTVVALAPPYQYFKLDGSDNRHATSTYLILAAALGGLFVMISVLYTVKRKSSSRRVTV